MELSHWLKTRLDSPPIDTITWPCACVNYSRLTYEINWREEALLKVPLENLRISYTLKFNTKLSYKILPPYLSLNIMILF